jgi:Ca2+/H+ antiporter, TMEM165/GDT1 family
LVDVSFAAFATAFATTFAAVFLAELPDKTMVATLVLTATYRRPLAVWIGVASAFTVHAGVATLAGGLLSRLPHRVIALAAALLFAVGAFVLWRSRDDSMAVDGNADGQRRPFGKVVAAGFATVIVAELGDLTQLTIAGLAARSNVHVAVFAGGLAALWSVAALATTVGRTLIGRLPTRALHIGAATLFAALAIASTVAAIRG